MQVRPLKSTKGNKFTACTKLLTPETKFLLKCQISYMVILIKKKKKKIKELLKSSKHICLYQGEILWIPKSYLNYSNILNTKNIKFCHDSCPSIAHQLYHIRYRQRMKAPTPPPILPPNFLYQRLKNNKTFLIMEEKFYTERMLLYLNIHLVLSLPLQ